MKQILHIFAKDVRSLRAEILLTIAMTTLFAWAEARSWWAASGEGAGMVPDVRNYLLLLIPVSWWLLIGRVIQAECPVGDRQFWVTRPYEWKKLLTAKALFLVCFLYIPFFTMECWLLVRAGFSPLAYLPGLFYRLLLISAIVFPLIAIAVVTSNFARMTLTSLAVCPGSLAVLLLLGLLFHGRVGVSTDYFPIPNGGAVSILIALGVCACAITLQYALRRVVPARLLLLSVPILIALNASFLNSAVSVNHIFPRIAQSSPFQISAAGPMDGASSYLYLDQVHLSVPVHPSGVRDGEYWKLDAVRATLIPATGAPLKLHWQSGTMRLSEPDDPRPDSFRLSDVRFMMSKADFDRYASMPVTLHFDFAFTQARRVNSVQIALPTGQFMVPDFGSCNAQMFRAGQVSGAHMGGIICRFPLRMPMLTHVSTFWSQGPCLASPPNAGEGIESSAEIGDFDAAPAGLGISSVEEHWLWTTAPNLCPGTPVTFTEYRPVRHLQTELTLQNFRLPSYSNAKPEN